MTESLELIKVRKHGKGDVLLADAKQIAANPKVLIPVGKAMREAAAPVADVPEVEAPVDAESVTEEIVVDDAGTDGNEPPTLTRKDMTPALRAKGHKVSTKLNDDEVTAMFVEHCSE